MTRLLMGWGLHLGRWMTPIYGGHWDWGAAGGPNQAPLLLGESNQKGGATCRRQAIVGIGIGGSFSSVMGQPY